MVFITHLGFGVLIGSYSHSTSGIILSGVGSVLPDIDIAFSKISKLSLNSNGNKLKHRGITHSLLMPILIYSIYYSIFKNQIILPFVLGYVSHIFLDMFNPKGVKLFLPFFWRSFRFPLTVKTGSVYDYSSSVFFWALALFSLFKRF